jgi:hypothetical protein
MLVAMAITLVMMAAVVTLFANVSNSVRNRRANIEMSNQVRHLRNVLQQDLQGATCPGVTWQRPDSNHGYIELIEGIYTDQNPTPLVEAGFSTATNRIEVTNSELDPALSPIPRNNVGADANSDGKITAQELEAHYQDRRSLVPGALGDFDDILMLTTRNEREPFVGRIPTNVRQNATTAYDFNVIDSPTNPGWDYGTIESPLAEVVWFAVENPADVVDKPDINNFFGEPGMRTIYRRTFLIAPWINPYRFTRPDGTIVDTFRYDGEEFKAEPGLVRLLPADISLEQAIAAIIAFQDRYDLSVRLEWDNNLQPARWKIMANTLADLTKRENRYGHYGLHHEAGPNNTSKRSYPYPMVSWGRGYDDSDLEFITDPDLGNPTQPARGGALAGPAPLRYVANYEVAQVGLGYPAQPLVTLPIECSLPATARAMLDDDGRIVRVVFGPVPLWGARRGEDIMMTGVLGFDMRVYDPGAPLFGVRAEFGNRNSKIETVLQPSDPGWATAYQNVQDHNGGLRIGQNDLNYPLVSQGAYVDMGYQFNRLMLPPPTDFLFHKDQDQDFFNSAAAKTWFFKPRGMMDVRGNLLTPGYTAYDTWSFHFENNGVDEDDRDGDNNALTGADEATNGLDDVGYYWDPVTRTYISDIRLGPDDAGERETTPPYDKPLRGMQVLIRTYEPDSRAIRQVRVNQHFLPE